jgi:hypothetical protein
MSFWTTPVYMAITTNIGLPCRVVPKDDSPKISVNFIELKSQGATMYYIYILTPLS